MRTKINLDLFLIGAIAVITLAIAPNLMFHPYHSIKHVFLLFIGPLALLYYYKRIDQTLIFTEIEILLLLRFAWLAITSPDSAPDENNLDLLLLGSLTLVSLSLRQYKSHSNHKNNSDKTVVLDQVYWAIIVLALLEAGIGIIQYYVYRDISSTILKTPIIGTIGSANGFGLFLYLGLTPLVLKQVHNYRRTATLKPVPLLAICILILVIILNQSRGATLAFLTSMFIAYLLYLRKSGYLSRSKIQSVKTITGILVLSLTLILTSLFLFNVNPGSSQGRIFVWRISVPMLQDNPVYGVGFGNYPLYYLEYQAKFLDDEQNLSLSSKAASLKQAHNEYLQAFLEGGIIGGGLFLLLWGVLILNMIKALFREWSLLSSTLLIILMTIGLHSLVDSPLHIIPVTFLFYILLGLAPASFSVSWRLRGYQSVFLTTLLTIILLFTVKISYRYTLGHYYWNCASSMVQQRQIRQSLPLYKKALNYLQNKGELLFNYGSALILCGENSEGVLHLKEAKKSYNDRNLELSMSLGLMNMGKHNQAKAYALNALAMFPDHLAPHLILGQIYFHLREHEKAKQSLLLCMRQKTTIRSFDTEQIAQDARYFYHMYGY